MDEAALLLAGGRSTRMGRTKAALAFDGVPLVRRLVDVLRAAAGRVVVARAPGQELPPLPDDVGLVEDARGGAGPLQGLATGLTVLAPVATRVFVAAVDLPFLGVPFVRRVLDLLGEHDAAVPRAGGHDHPLAAAWNPRVAAPADVLLARGERSLRALLEQVDVRYLEADELSAADPGLRSLINVNTPAEYAAALRRSELRDDG